MASGIVNNDQFPEGTILMQAPFFKNRGVDLSEYFFGTLNIDISPNTWKGIKAWKYLEAVKWYEKYPAENFSFFQCRISVNETIQEGLIYFPSPETKISQFQSKSTIEIITKKINSVYTSCKIDVYYN